MTKVAFASKAPHTTWNIHVEFNVKKKPKLLADLEAAGWECNWSYAAPPVENVQEITLTYPGTGLFGGWKPKDRETAMSKARKVLSKHGFDAIPYHMLEMADCI